MLADGLGLSVIGIAHSRPGPDLVQLDLLDKTKLVSFLKGHKPDCKF